MPSAAGFIIDPGATQIISTTTVSGFNRAFDAQGRLRRAATFSKTSLDTLAQYGVNRDAMVLASFTRDQEQPAFADDPGAQSRWVALAGGRHVVGRYDDWALSVQGLAGWGRSLDAAGFVADTRLVLARGFEFRARPAFVELQAGWRHGGKVERSEARLDATLGLHVTDQWLLLGQLFGAHAPRTGNLPEAWRLKGAVSIAWRVNERWTLQAGGFTTLYGRSSVYENGVNLAIWRRF